MRGRRMAKRESTGGGGTDISTAAVTTRSARAAATRAVARQGLGRPVRPSNMQVEAIARRGGGSGSAARCGSGARLRCTVRATPDCDRPGLPLATWHSVHCPGGHWPGRLGGSRATKRVSADAVPWPARWPFARWARAESLGKVLCWERPPPHFRVPRWETTLWRRTCPRLGPVASPTASPPAIHYATLTEGPRWDDRLSSAAEIYVHRSIGRAGRACCPLRYAGPALEALRARPRSTILVPLLASSRPRTVEYRALR